MKNGSELTKHHHTLYQTNWGHETSKVFVLIQSSMQQNQKLILSPSLGGKVNGSFTLLETRTWLDFVATW